MARHRGWRNPYRQVDSLISDNPYSKQYGELKEKAKAYNDDATAAEEESTPAQLVVAMLDAGYAKLLDCVGVPVLKNRMRKAICRYV